MAKPKLTVGLAENLLLSQFRNPKNGVKMPWATEGGDARLDRERFDTSNATLCDFQQEPSVPQEGLFWDNAEMSFPTAMQCTGRGSFTADQFSLRVMGRRKKRQLYKQDAEEPLVSMRAILHLSQDAVPCTYVIDRSLHSSLIIFVVSHRTGPSQILAELCRLY